MSYSDIKQLLTDAKNIATGANDLQLKGKLLDIQNFIYELQEENRNLRDRVVELENDKIVRNNLEYKNNAYYKIGEDIPYCTRCFDVDSKLVTMFLEIDGIHDNYFFACPNCEKRFYSDMPHGVDLGWKD